MPSKRLATVVETYCPNDGHIITIRCEEGEEECWVKCWNCSQQIFLRNGFGPNNFKVVVEDPAVIRGRETAVERRLRYVLIWQQSP